METRITDSKANGEGRVIQIRSFSDPNLTYRTNVTTLECTCKRFRFTGRCIKHVLLARALADLDVRFGKDAAKEELTDLVERIFSPMTVQESYRVFQRAMTSPYANNAIRNTAQRRHLSLIAEVA